MKKPKIKALMVEPQAHPRITALTTSMQALRTAVSAGADEIGDVESKQIGNNVYIIYNRDRVFSNLIPNRRIGDDIIAGVFYVLAVDKNGYPISMTDNQLNTYSKMFWETEYISEREAVAANLEYMFKLATTE